MEAGCARAAPVMCDGSRLLDLDESFDMLTDNGGFLLRHVVSFCDIRSMGRLSCANKLMAAKGTPHPDHVALRTPGRPKKLAKKLSKAENDPEQQELAMVSIVEALCCV